MKVVHIKKDHYNQYIGRPSLFGNPFSLDQYTRTEAVEKYEQYARENPKLLRAISELPADAILGCFCAPRLCHGDAIVKLWKEINENKLDVPPN